jgi:hypothetical protein
MSKFDPSKGPAELTGFLHEVLDGNESYQKIRHELIILGHYAANAADQMGKDGRPSAELLVRVWAKMARDGDADAALVLRSLAEHPLFGPLIAAHGNIDAQ